MADNSNKRTLVFDFELFKDGPDAWYIAKELNEANPEATMDEIRDTTLDIQRKVAHLSKVLAPAQAAPPAPPVDTGPGLSWPPGTAGALAYAFFGASIRPVREVAIATALAALAGVCGRTWNTNTGAGLNLYIAFVGRSAIGKEAIADSISTLLCEASKKGGLDASSFFTFNNMASGQGLLKFMADVPDSCVLHVNGEFGHDIQFMATEKSGPYATLRKEMTRIYPKSGGTSIAGGVNYSNRENSVTIGGSASYSVIGETTPSTFYEALDGKMMADGFMSRFVVIDYNGPRPPANEQRGTLDAKLVDWFKELVAQASLKARGQPQTVLLNPDAAAMLKAFDKDCDKNINGTEDESRRQMWNRAQLNALKVASLLAVADNYLNPLITATHAAWAISLLQRNIAAMTKRLESGHVGSGDDARERQLVALLREYIGAPVAASYNIPEEMRSSGIVPRQYLAVRIRRQAAFYNHRLDTSRALDETLGAMLANGYLMEVDKAKAIEAYGYKGRCFRITRLPDYGT